MASIVVRTKPITREKLAKFFPDNHELVRLLETLAQDVTVNIPDVINPDSLALEDTIEGLGIARALADAAQALAIRALTLAMQAVDGPPALPAPVQRLDDTPPVLLQVLPDIPEDTYSVVCALRERLAVAERAIAQLKEGPSP